MKFGPRLNLLAPLLALGAALVVLLLGGCNLIDASPAGETKPGDPEAALVQKARAGDASAQEREIAQQVENFVTHMFIRKPQFVIDRTVIVHNQDIGGGEVESKPFFAEHAGFAFQQEGSRGG